MSLKRKVRFGAGAIGAVFLAQAAVSALTDLKLAAIGDQERVMSAAMRNHMQGDMDHDAIRSSVFHVLHAAARGDAKEVEAASAEVDEFGADLNRAVAENRKLSLDPDIQTDLSAVQGLLGSYVSTAKTLAEAAKRDPAAAEAMLPQFDMKFRELEKRQEQLAEQISNKLAEVESQGDGVQTISLLVILLVSALAATALGWAIRQLGRTVIRPIDGIAAQLREMTDGDFSRSIENFSEDEEIVAIQSAAQAFRLAGLERQRQQAANEHVVKALGEGLSVMASGDLTHAIEKPFEPEYEELRQTYNTSASKLRNLLEQVLFSAQSVANGASEILAASEDLALRNEKQAASVEETSAAMNQITSVIAETASTVTEVQATASKSHQQASEGGIVVREAIDAMASIEKSSNEIAHIVGVMDGIAFQTNLLALNAGVEAARAGEAGKGFAVVANEVRALAQRSAEAAKDIKELIGKATSQVAGGVAMVGRTGDVLNSIIKNIGEITTHFSDIADRTSDQSISMMQINGAVNDMDRMTQENVAMVEQSSAASRSLSGEARNLSELVGQFRTSDKLASSESNVRPAARSISANFKSLPKVQGNLALVANSDNDWTEF